MKVMKTTGSMLGILIVLMLGFGAAGSDVPDGSNEARAAQCVGLAIDMVDYRVVHAIWQRPSWVASGQVPRDSKLWL